MASDYIEEMRFRIIAEAQEANATIETVGKNILELAKLANVPIKVFSDTIKEVAGIGGEFDKLITKATSYASALEKASEAQTKLALKSSEKVSQLQAVSQVDANDAAYAQRLANQEKERKLAEQRALAFGKELEMVNKLDAELKQLDARLKNGTATIKEYSVALAQMIKPSTLAATKNIAPNLFTKDTVAQVKTTMMEIQAITKLEAGKVAAIMKTMFPNIDTRNIEAAKRSLQGIEPAAKKAAGGLFSLKNVARTALGTFEAMAIFFVTRFVGQAITKTIDSLKQLELAFYKIGIAEKSLSKMGVDINPQDLQAISDEVQKTFTFISQVDSLRMVSNLALLTKDLRLTKDQILDLAKAIPVLATSADISIESATDQIITGLTKSGRGWADLGITVDAAIIRQQAVKDGLVESEAAYNKLTAEQKQQVEVLALISILNNNVADSMKEQGPYMDTITGKTKKLSGSWEDFTTKAGILFQPAIRLALDVSISFIDTFINGLEMMKEAYVGFMGVMVGGWTALSAIIKFPQMKIEDIRKLFRQASFEAMAALDEAMTPKAGEDTPTGTPPEIQTEDALQPVEDLQGALDKMNNEILEAQLKLAQDMEDAAIDLGRKLEDITIEYSKKRAEAEIDYASKVSDINRDYANKIADINAKQQEARKKAQEDERQREREHQNKLQEMREKFLMDLDDALHARDARQILKLIKQYELDKLQAEREFALQQGNAKKEEELRQQSFANERAAADRDRKAKLAEAQRDYADKLAKLRADEEAERAAAQLKYEREKQDLEKAMLDRLEIVAANLVGEFNLTNEGLNAIVQLYRQYYSEVAGIYAAMQAMIGGGKNIGMTMAPGNQVNKGAIATNKSGGGSLGKRFAEGGTMIADRPTTVTFGDSGLEMGTFTPINRNGRDVNKVFTNLSGAGSEGAGGAVSIELLLSPDLESRIVSNTLNRTAQVFTKTMRTKR